MDNTNPRIFDNKRTKGFISILDLGKSITCSYCSCFRPKVISTAIQIFTPETRDVMDLGSAQPMLCKFIGTISRALLF